MADFCQTGMVTTLHRLGQLKLESLEQQLEYFAEQQPIALVLPALYSEFEKPAMAGILHELSRVRYVKQFIVTLAQAQAEQVREVQQRLAFLPGEVRVLWNDGPRVQKLYSMLEENGLHVGPDGKGRSCWMAYGYVLASRQAEVIALHDCDILSYSRELLARLCFPVVHSSINFQFCKGYYARVSDRMHGRVTRLFMTPLIRAMAGMAPNVPVLQFLDSFRYCLAGEFAMKANLARANRIPGDWGLEVGMLAEVYRNFSPTRTCQVDLADNYDHKHQALSAQDPGKGLRRMACDIAKTLFRTLAGEGVALGQEHFRALEVRYVRIAEDTMVRYYADALLNGLHYNRNEEELAVATFAQSLRQAAAEFLADPLGLPLIPNWNRVVAAVPDFLESLVEAVESDADLARCQAA